MIYRRIDSQNDPDISCLDEILNLPEISRFINVDKNNYWTYVTNTENVFYFKVFENDVLVAATHLEILNETMYMDVMVIPMYQRKGIATKIIKDIQSGNIPFDFGKIEVSIDKSNIASIKLFEKMNFKFVSAENELLNYAWQKI
ncbi:MAG: GNAT family N-acetyltransferase [Clostridia bacterium]|nr:GNAT family N-acetyltransferase [Clostridia bacterium]